MKKHFLLVILIFCVLSLSGCNETNVDQCLRTKLFQECLKLLPAGPTNYNDWSNVVDSCDNTAYHQSIRLSSQIKDECRSK